MGSGRNLEHAGIYKSLLCGQASLGKQQEDLMQKKQTIFLLKATSMLSEPRALHAMLCVLVTGRVQQGRGAPPVQTSGVATCILLKNSW